MLNLIKSWAKSEHVRVPLAELLSRENLKEDFLGVSKDRLKSNEETVDDAIRLLRFAQTEDYAVFLKEIWETVCLSVKKLTEENLKETEVNYQRGYLSASLDILKISYNVQRFMESERSKKTTSASPRTSPPLGR